jgi:membrane-associated phospholipid phosphatase
MKNYKLKFIIFFLSICFLEKAYPQSYDSDLTNHQSLSIDSIFHPYHLNYWATGGIILGGLTLEKIGVAWISNKAPISIGELQNLNRHDITPIDSWALDFDPAKMNTFKRLSDQLQTVIVFTPFLTLLDHNIRRDWLDVLLLYLQAQTITNNFYLYSPFGATFQNRFRPVVYYTAFGDSSGARTASNNRNSLYSGHVAAASVASFFTAKVYCDYHPELGMNKYFVYAAASVPPLIMSYFRLRALAHFPTDIMVGFGVGALCGILVPEFHRINDQNISFGLFSSFEATGIAVKWQPGFLK